MNYRSLYEPTLYAAEDVMYTLFELDEHYPGTRLYEVTDTTDLQNLKSIDAMQYFESQKAL